MSHFLLIPVPHGRNGDNTTLFSIFYLYRPGSYKNFCRVLTVHTQVIPLKSNPSSKNLTGLRSQSCKDLYTVSPFSMLVNSSIGKFLVGFVLLIQDFKQGSVRWNGFILQFSLGQNSHWNHLGLGMGATFASTFMLKQCIWFAHFWIGTLYSFMFVKLIWFSSAIKWYILFTALVKQISIF